jgi:hypothetical protein
MSATHQTAVGFLLEELCQKFGICSPCREQPRFLDLRLRGADQFTEAAFVAEGLDPHQHAALFKTVRQHVSQALACLEGDADAA